MKPKVSIITVVRNAPQQLDKTLENLTGLQPGAAEIELILIDGASDDPTLRVIERYRDRLSIVVSEPDNGLYDAMNKGIEKATGDYLWFINAGDTVYRPDILDLIFAQEPHGDVYFGETLVTDPTTERVLGFRQKHLPAALDWKSLRRGMVVCHQSFIVKKSLAPLYDTDRYRLAADIDWVIRCLRNARDVRNTHQVLSCFALGGISTKHRKESLRERWRIMREHYGYFPTLWAHTRLAGESFIRAVNGSPAYRPLSSGKAEL